jgi:hypothetical protein
VGLDWLVPDFRIGPTISVLPGFMTSDCFCFGGKECVARNLGGMDGCRAGEVLGNTASVSYCGDREESEDGDVGPIRDPGLKSPTRRRRRRLQGVTQLKIASLCLYLLSFFFRKSILSKNQSGYRHHT